MDDERLLDTDENPYVDAEDTALTGQMLPWQSTSSIAENSRLETARTPSPDALPFGDPSGSAAAPGRGRALGSGDAEEVAVFQDVSDSGDEDDVRESFRNTGSPVTFPPQASSHEPVLAPRVVSETAHRPSSTIARSRDSDSETSALLESPGILNDRGAASELPSSASLANAPDAFRGDNAKPWFSYGRTEVDRSTWVPDESVATCTACHAIFTFWVRRHHCRYCGRIFCANCSSKFMLLPVEYGVREPQRTCSECATRLEAYQEELASTIANHTRTLAPPPPDAPVSSVSAFLDSLMSRNPVSFSMTAEIDKAARVMKRIFGRKPVPSSSSNLSLSTPTGANRLLAESTALGRKVAEFDTRLPFELVRQAKGIAFLTVIKGGLLVSAKVGTGLVVARLPQQNGLYRHKRESSSDRDEDRDLQYDSRLLPRFSAPSAIGIAGLGWGAQIGGEITDFVFLLTSDAAVDAFSGRRQFSLGAGLGVAVGPMGRSAEAMINVGDGGIAPIYAFNQSLGLFAGLSLEGAVISARNDVNTRFYGRTLDPMDILRGGVPPPTAGGVLYEAIDDAFSAALSQGR